MSEQNFLRAIDAIYGATTEPDTWTDALRIVASLVGARGALFLAADLDKKRTLISGAAGICEDALIQYQARWAYADPRAQVLLQRPAATAMSDADMFTERQMDAHPYYAWLKSWDFRHAIASNLERHGRISSWLSVQYALDHGAPTDGEVDTFKRIVPHILRAAGISARLLASDTESRSFAQALSGLATPVLLVTSSLHVVFANRAAEALLAAGIVKSHPIDGLQGPDFVSTRALRQLVFESTTTIEGHAPPPRAVALPRANAEPPLVVNALPIPHQPGTIRSGAVAALFFGDPNAAPSPQRTIAALRAAFPLTRAESEIVAGLAAGDSVEGLALRRASTPATIATQIKSALRKTGAENRAELLRLAIALSGPLGR